MEPHSTTSDTNHTRSGTFPSGTRGSSHGVRRSRRNLRRRWRAGCRLIVWLLDALWLRACGRWQLCHRLTKAALRQSGRLGCWLLHQLLSPALCFGCIYGGVLLTVLLPASLWATFALPVANLVGPPLTAFPFAELPDSAKLGQALLAALPLALVVFRHAYSEWRSPQDPLGARMLYACAAGVAWPKVWFRIRRSRQDGVP